MQVYVVTQCYLYQVHSFHSVHSSFESARDCAKEILKPSAIRSDGGEVFLDNGNFFVYREAGMESKVFPVQLMGENSSGHWNTLKEYCKSLVSEEEDRDDDFFLELFKGVLSDAAKLKVGSGHSYMGARETFMREVRRVK